MVYYSQSESLTAHDLVAWALETYGDRFAIACSFQREAMTIIDMAWRMDRRVRVFTLDTGRLPAETYEMMDTLHQRYGVCVERVQPDPSEVAAMVSQNGTDLFRDSVELRHLCCTIRKVRPLERKLAELGAWAAGLRREQSAERASIAKVERGDSIVKIHPLADWTSAEVDQYIQDHDVPLHPLYARGFASIGCEPCTRALKPGESGRDGRWWWENGARKECGIHFAPEGQIRRSAAGLIPLESGRP